MAPANSEHVCMCELTLVSGVIERDERQGEEGEGSEKGRGEERRRGGEWE